MSIRKIKSKKDLEIVLQSLEIFSNPNPHLEQYSTPSSAAATLLWKAYMDGEISEKVVYDLGCGTGILSIGAMLLGARKVVGIDLDEDALRIAMKNASRLGVDVSFVREDVKNLEARADVVVQNPPFGSQRKGNDRIFIEKSLEIAPVVYSFHMAETKDFVEKFVQRFGVVEYVMPVDFMLSPTMPWHRKRLERINVLLFKFVRKE